MSLSDAATAAWPLQLHRIHSIFCPVWAQSVLFLLHKPRYGVVLQHSWHMVLAGSTTKAGALKKKGWLRPGQHTQYTAALLSVSSNLLVPDLLSCYIMHESICMCIYFDSVECGMLWRIGGLGKRSPEWSAAMLERPFSCG